MIGYYSTWSSTDSDSFNQLIIKILFERISTYFYIFSLIFTFNHYLYTAKIHQVIYTGTISLAIISQASQWCRILKPRILTQPSSGRKHIRVATRLDCFRTSYSRIDGRFEQILQESLSTFFFFHSVLIVTNVNLTSP